MSSSNSWTNTSFEIDKISHTWTIENFDVLFDFNAYHGLTSSKFPRGESGLQFSLRCAVLHSGLMDVEITSFANDLKHKCKLETWIQGRRENATSIFFTLPKSTSTSLIGLDSFRKERDTILINGNLTIMCVITVLKNISEQQGNSGKVPFPQLSKDLGALLETKDFTDVTIITADGHKIPAHKNILSARSKVFAAMFKHPMKENTENCVAISDFSYDVVMKLLRFIYTGEVNNLQEMSTDLMAAADKYELNRLKAICAEFMGDNLSIETAPIVLKASDLYNMKDLKSEAIKFIKSNIPEVTETSNWMDLVTTDKLLILESFIDQKLVEIKRNNESSKEDEEVQAVKVE
ncbi:protein roadkill-like [Drosophila innubila]|uniref:protein roadkill-like n=1 Tax=Drosophila innubila TaxID=198719 RepID=UPI00148DF609|nr:protein roadkill-like [Drosophila innubila]